MPRKGRIISSSRIYHVVSRGNEKKPIFLDTEDHEHFIGILRRKQIGKRSLSIPLEQLQIISSI